METYLTPALVVAAAGFLWRVTAAAEKRTTHRLDEFREDQREMRREVSEMRQEHGQRLARIEGRLDPAPRLPPADPE